MAPLKGWIKLHRKILNWQWYDDNATYKIFTYLIMSANYEDVWYRGELLKQGTLSTSLTNIHIETKLSLNTVKKSLKNLESTGEITTKKSGKKIIITIANYTMYQHEEFDDLEENNFNTTLSKSNKKKLHKQSKLVSKLDTKSITKSNEELSKIDSKNEFYLYNKEIKNKELENQRKKREKVTSTLSSKTPYAEFVFLRDDEFENLVQEVGEDGVKSCIEMLNNYKGSSGKKYESDYYAIKKWCIKALKTELKEENETNTETNFNVKNNCTNPLIPIWSLDWIHSDDKIEEESDNFFSSIYRNNK